ncbi:MAG: sugar ABC transporter ATP-binding protein [Lachnospiraceae bacterium]|nr:sugar ABC transporter ATP-binding protein [Lachnospiraceae bacterium]
MGKELLKAMQVYKSFGPTKALVNVDFTLYPGEVHGLIGENGSGKSTLSTIIAGVQRADSGSLFLKGEKYDPKNALAANSQGICMLLQEQGTFDGISVAANIFVGKEKEFVQHGLLNTRKLFIRGEAALQRIGAEGIRPEMNTSQLNFEERKLVEIARAMESDPDILIVDETTTALSRKGRDLLYRLMEQMKERGKSVIFISHDIGEVKEVCDYLTVLRDGAKIDTLAKEDFSDDRIRKLMVGREVSENFYRNDNHATRQEEVAVRLTHVSYGRLKDINMEVHKGEIVGIGGLTDCGMHDLGKIMFGLIKPDQGHCELGNGTVIKNSVEAIRQGMGYVAKDRDKEALMMGASIRDNICAPALKKLSRRGFITSRREKEYVNQWAKELSVKMNSIDQYVMYLSGGNKQKVSVAKWVGFDADILIFDCPTRGIDIGVKAAIYQLLTSLKECGKAILMISEELMEIIGMSDRTIIMKDGVITGEFRRDDMLTEDKLIEYII